MCRLLCVTAFLLGAALAQDRPDLNGTWQMDAAHSPTADRYKSQTLSINQKPDSIQIVNDAVEANGKEARQDLQCATDGRDCKAKDVTMTFWYNGATLVSMEMRHGNSIVIKRRFDVSEDGKTLKMQVSHISPPGLKEENYVFVRQQTAAVPAK